MPKRKLTKYEDDVRRNLRNPAENNPAQSPHDGIHTCSKGCKKPGCNRTLRDTIEEQDAQIVALKQDLLEKSAELRKSEEHNEALCERMQDLNSELFTASCTNARLHSLFANSEQENARLKAEVERVVKAGDAMAELIAYELRIDEGQKLPESVQRWNAAKEGKQS